jgi:hypothetical protein
VAMCQNFVIHQTRSRLGKMKDLLRYWQHSKVRGNKLLVVALLGGDYWRTAVNTQNALTVHCRLHPCARKLDQNLFRIFGFGLASPTHRLIGLLAEPIGL